MTYPNLKPSPRDSEDYVGIGGGKEFYVYKLPNNTWMAQAVWNLSLRFKGKTLADIQAELARMDEQFKVVAL